MDEQTKIALKNYDWLVRESGLDDVELDWETELIAWGDTRESLSVLIRAGLTPATRS